MGFWGLGVRRVYGFKFTFRVQTGFRNMGLEFTFKVGYWSLGLKFIYDVNLGLGLLSGDTLLSPQSG